MPLVSPRLRIVNPVALAVQSGITHFPPPGPRIPAIPRPGSWGTFLPPGPYVPSIPRFGIAGLAGMGQVSLPGVSDLPDIYTSGSESADSGVLGAIRTGSIEVPGIGTIDTETISFFQKAWNAFEDWLGIGEGRREADIIVPVQNAWAQSWGPIITGLNAAKVGQFITCEQLVRWYRQLWQSTVAFIQFVSQPIFTDGRASTQALNALIPVVTGQCGFSWPPPFHPTQQGCPDAWGTVWGAPVATGYGLLGELRYRIEHAVGCAVPPITPGPGGIIPPIPPGSGGTLLGGLSGTTILVGVGILALAMYGRRARG